MTALRAERDALQDEIENLALNLMATVEARDDHRRALEKANALLVSTSEALEAAQAQRNILIVALEESYDALRDLLATVQARYGYATTQDQWPNVPRTEAAIQKAEAALRAAGRQP